MRKDLHMKQTQHKNKLVKLVFTSLFAALVCVSTMMIKIPTSTNGYIHLGDAMVLLSGFLLGPLYGVIASAIGSMFADVFGSYFIYAPATLIIKGLTALFACVVAKIVMRLLKKHQAVAYIAGGIVGELFMVLGYYLFEATICGYGFVAAALSIPANILQGISGIVIGVLLVIILQKTHITERFIGKYGFLDL